MNLATIAIWPQPLGQPEAEAAPCGECYYAERSGAFSGRCVCQIS